MTLWWQKILVFVISFILAYIPLGYVATFFWVKGKSEEFKYNPLTLPHAVGSVYVGLIISLCVFAVLRCCDSLFHATGDPRMESERTNNRKCRNLSLFFVMWLVALAIFYPLVVRVYTIFY